MRQFILILFLVLGGISLHGQQKIDSNYIFSGYTERLEYFKEIPRQTKKPVVFLGNSITEAGRWSDMLPGKPVLNRGISGDISFGVVARMDEIVSLKPSKVFLLIGVNDLKREIPTKYIIQNYKAIVKRLRQELPKTKIYLQSVLPVNNELLIDAFKSVDNRNIALLNDALESMSDEKKVIYVNLHKVFADANGELKPSVTPDGIHLHLPAYTHWVEFLKTKKYL